MTLLMVAAAVATSSLATAALLGAVRWVANRRRRRRDGAPGTALRRVPRVAEAGARARLWSLGWLVVRAIGAVGPVTAPLAEPGTRDPVRWSGSQLLRATADGNRFILDCLVQPEKSVPVGIPMAVFAHCPPAGGDAREIDAAIRSWANAGTPVDIALRVERGVAVVRMVGLDTELTLELDAPPRP